MPTLEEFLYSFVHTLDSLSRLLGAGAFEIGDEWKCTACLNSPKKTLCLECKSNYLSAVAYLKPTSAFERRMNIRVGIHGLLIGLSGSFQGLIFELWNSIPYLKSQTSTLLSHIPEAILLSFAPGGYARTVYDLILIVNFVANALVIATLGLVAFFLMTVNPVKTRKVFSNKRQKLRLAVAYLVFYVFLRKGDFWEVFRVTWPFVLGLAGIEAWCWFRCWLRGEVRVEERVEDVEKGKGS